MNHNKLANLFMGKEEWQKKEWRKREEYRKKCKYYSSNDRCLAPIPVNRNNCWFALYCPRMRRYDKLYLDDKVKDNFKK